MSKRKPSIKKPAKKPPSKRQMAAKRRSAGLPDKPGKPTTLAEQMAADAGHMALSDESLQKLSSFAMRQLVLEDELEELTRQAQEKADELRRVREGDLPDAMDEIGMSEFKLTDGTSIKVDRSFAATITEKTRPGAHGWLRSNGHGDLIKHIAIVKFIRGQEKKAKELFKQLTKAGLAFDDKEAVHPQTLKAFVKEQMTAVEEQKKGPGKEPGIDFPQSLFNVFPVRKSKVKKPK